MFVAYLPTRNIQYEEDLVDQIFNSSKKRLARVLLLLAQFGKDGEPQVAIPKISQETLAEMVEATRWPSTSPFLPSPSMMVVLSLSMVIFSPVRDPQSSHFRGVEEAGSGRGIGSVAADAFARRS
jgi:hypothetical protein